jgi:tetratricopeptide (TPR) repeat protein
MIRRRLGVVAVLASLALTTSAACTFHSHHTPTPTHTPTVVSQNDPDALLSEGIRQGDAGDFDTANSNFRRVLTLDKNNKFAWYNLGVIAGMEDNSAEAIRDYDSALALDPTFTPAMYNKAILIEGSNPDTAIDLYQKIITINTSASTTYLRLGLLLAKKGDHAGALDNLRSAIAIDPTLINSIPSGLQDEVRGG